MKKSFVILIGIIYLATIVFIGFFGLKISIYNETIYVTKIEVINEDVKINEFGLYVVKDYTDDFVYQLEWKVYPEIASDRGVEFVYDKNSTVASVNNFGAVIFNKYGTITISIYSVDGSEISTKITIITKKPA